MVVARSNVNQLLSSQPSRWGFVNTWVLFWAHAAIPVGLFWFLDYTSALHDTALIGALLVAFGYRQIFAGGIQGITMPGQTPRLWQPFEAWVNRIKEQIATQDKDSADLFNAKVRVYLAGDETRLQGLRNVCFTHTLDPAALQNKLAAVKTPAVEDALKPSIEQWKSNEHVRVLLSDLRMSQPVSYGLFLYQNRLITGWMYHNWKRSGRSRWVGRVGATVIGLAMVLGAWECYSRDGVKLWYCQWRLTKTGVSDLDRFRNREYLAGRLKTAGQATPPNLQQLSDIVSPLVRRLRFDGTSPQTADDILALFIDSHSPAEDNVVVPQLIEALRNPNADLRLRIRRALCAFQLADYSHVVPDELAGGWVPDMKETAGDIDLHVRAWLEWWRLAQTPPTPHSS
jgi:hypothetical protein